MMNMSPYRAPPKLNLYIVEARVSGPLSEFPIQVVVQAQDPGNAIVRFVEDVTEHGFDLLSEPLIVTLPEISLDVPDVRFSTAWPWKKF